MKMEFVKSFEERNPLVDLSKPSIAALSYALRHRETWPKDFKWNFFCCTTCAMGLAARLWTQLRPFHENIGANLGVSISAAHRIFVQAAWEWGGPTDSPDVSPEDIADLLDAHLAEHG